MFTVGHTYTRASVQELVGVPEDRRGGNWDTGYTTYEGQTYVFCNVGTAGRTGHDYANRWDGAELVWEAKSRTHVDQPEMRAMVSGTSPIHVFWREDSADARFIYSGIARITAVEARTPVQFRFAFQPSEERQELSLRDLVGNDGRLFAKSEFGPASDEWPALSFSSRKVASSLALDFRRGRDFVVYVGTTDPKRTQDASHRSALLSAVTFEPRAPISTQQIVPSASWQRAVQRWGVRWEWSFPIVEAYEFTNLPSAREIIPLTYAGLGNLQSLGRAIPVDANDLGRLLDTTVFKKPLALRTNVERALALNVDDPSVRRMLSRLAQSIHVRIQNSGQERTGNHPERSGPNLSDIFASLNQKWTEQGGTCSLCGCPIPLTPSNSLLQASPDRITSETKTYDAANVHLTHLACNLGKSSASMEEWREYLALLRSVTPS